MSYPYLVKGSMKVNILPFINPKVFKLTAAGKVELVIGEQFVNGDDDKHFCKPTDVAVTKDGEFFVSDGSVVFLLK